jgi:hypothetical protein
VVAVWVLGGMLEVANTDPAVAGVHCVEDGRANASGAHQQETDSSPPMQILGGNLLLVSWILE